VTSVAFENVLVALHPGPRRRRDVRADVAPGGAFYAIRRETGPAIHPALQTCGASGGDQNAVQAARQVVHPLDPGLKGIYGTIFTGPANVEGSDLRNVTIFADAEVDRSPCGTGTCAVMAVLDGMSLLPEGRPFVHEGIVDTTFRGRVLRHTAVGDYPAIVPELEGSAWITGDHHFMVDDEDPLKAAWIKYPIAARPARSSRPSTRPVDDLTPESRRRRRRVDDVVASRGQAGLRLLILTHPTIGRVADASRRPLPDRHPEIDRFTQHWSRPRLIPPITPNDVAVRRRASPSPISAAVEACVAKAFGRFERKMFPRCADSCPGDDRRAERLNSD
jgi:hypothetical protein